MGLAFSVGSTYYNLWYYPPGYWECSSSVTFGCGEGNSLAVDSLEIVPVSTPESGTLLLFGSGAFAVLLCRKRILHAGTSQILIQRDSPTPDRSPSSAPPGSSSESAHTSAPPSPPASSKSAELISSRTHTRITARETTHSYAPTPPQGSGRP